jgi:hypothetical protein
MLPTYGDLGELNPAADQNDLLQVFVQQLKYFAQNSPRRSNLVFSEI